MERPIVDLIAGTGNRNWWYPISHPAPTRLTENVKCLRRFATAPPWSSHQGSDFSQPLPCSSTSHGIPSI